MPIAHERYIRARNFKPAEYGASRWWLLSLSQEGATAQGVEMIEIEEIVETVTLGRLAIFRRWITDPNGQEFTGFNLPDRRQVQFRNEQRLRSNLKTMAFEPVPIRGASPQQGAALLM